MDTEKEVNRVMSELHFGDGSSLYGALINLRTTLIKSRTTLLHLVELGAVKHLVQLLEDRKRHVNQTKTTNIVMSILANICMEEDIREKVVNCDGLTVIARVTLASEQESIQNRGIRALANLAQDMDNCTKIMALEVPAFVAKRLIETEDAECRTTYCRALQLFGQTSEGVKKLVETQAVQALAALLKIDNRKMILKSLRVLSELSAIQCCSGFSGQILAANVLEELVTFADNKDSNTAFFALSILLRLCEQELMRPALGSAGIISLLVKLFGSGKSYMHKVSILNALCLCTKEAVNRNKIQELGGLELFISALKNDNGGSLQEGPYSMLYDRIISSLVNFIYHEDCFGKLLELGVVSILMQHLQRSCKFFCAQEDYKKDIAALAQALQSNSMHQEEAVACSQENVETDIETNKCSSHVGDISDKGISAKSDVGSPVCLSNIADHDLVDVLNPEDDPLIIDASKVTDKHGMVIDEGDVSEGIKSTVPSEGLDELPLPLASISGQTYSINSPTYQAETSWRLEDYISGITCKDFRQEHESSHAASLYPHNYNSSENTFQAPFSPLSTGVSYYSPTQSSPSYSVSFSPLNSPSFHTTSSQGSPAWSLSSPAQQSPAYSTTYSPFHNSANQSPHSSPYQSHFSPLTNTFPASPLPHFEDKDPQSPLFDSQGTLSGLSGSQELSQNSERSPDSPGTSQHVDLVPKEFTSANFKVSVLPPSQSSASYGTPVYSASEEDDDDDDNGADDCNYTDGEEELPLQVPKNIKETSSLVTTDKKSVGLQRRENLPNLNKIEETVTNRTNKHLQLLTQPDNFQTTDRKKQALKSKEVTDLKPNKKRCSNADYKSSPVHSSDNAWKEVDQSAKRRKLSNHKNHHVFESTEVDNKSVAELCDRDEPAIKQAVSIFEDHGFLLSSFSDAEDPVLSSQDQSGTGSAASNVHISNFNPKDCASETICESVSQKIFSHMKPAKNVIFQRLSSYPGKPRVPLDRMSASPTAGHGSSSVSSPSQVSIFQSLVSDSPYRSPFPEHAESPQVDSENHSGMSPCVSLSKKTVLEQNSLMVKSKKSELNRSHLLHVKAEIKTASGSRSQQPENDPRVQKILQTTESNILILLARISVKTNPTQYLAETGVIKSLLGYVGSAPNPLRRCCRILFRLCSNPLCFKKLILMQMPAFVIRSLILEQDGSLPSSVFTSSREYKSYSDLLASSQGSEGSGSQASEFGRKLDFEFGGDAYSRIALSNNHSSIRAFFQEQPSLSVDTQSTRDVLHGGGDIYEAEASRREVHVRIGLELLHALAVTAASSYGDGEILHILARYMLKERLACIISLLNLRVGWGHFSRHQLARKYKLWNEVLPLLFLPHAPQAREAIVAGISLNLHLDKPPKQVQEVITLSSCSDIVSSTGQALSHLSEGVTHTAKCSLNNRYGQPEIGGQHGKPQIRTSLQQNKSIGANAEMFDENNDSMSLNELKELEEKEMDCDFKTNKLCPYKNISHQHDVHFLINDEDRIHKIGVCREVVMQKSEVFAAMLGGSYRESYKTEIEIADMKCDSFEFIMHYLHGCASGCPVIDSLSLPGTNSESEQHCGDPVTKEPSDKSERSILNNSVATQISTDEATNAEFSSAGEKNAVCVDKVNSERVCQGQREQTRSIPSPALDILHTEDSLDSLTLEDKPENLGKSELSHKRQALESTNNNNNNNNNNVDCTRNHVENIEDLVNKCADILALADRFLLNELVVYLVALLSHVCLHPHTAENIFHLACFYKLDLLAVDCIREMLLSNLPSQIAAALFLDLARHGYKEQVHRALLRLVDTPAVA